MANQEQSLLFAEERILVMERESLRSICNLPGGQLS